MKRDFMLNIEKGDKIMKCVEYIYDEKETNELKGNNWKDGHETVKKLKWIDLNKNLQNYQLKKVLF